MNHSNAFDDWDKFMGKAEDLNETLTDKDIRNRVDLEVLGRLAENPSCSGILITSRAVTGMKLGEHALGERPRRHLHCYW
jgi:hypothetical protein